MSWVRVPSPTPDKVGDRGYPGPLFPSTLGRRQVVRQGTLTPSSAGSSPAVPAKVHGAVRGVFIECDPVAQSAEQLPFKQWVRGSNPRRVTNSSQASYRLRRVFYALHQKLIERSFCCSSFPNRIRFAGFRFGLERNKYFYLESVHAFQLVTSVISLVTSFLCSALKTHPALIGQCP